MASSTWDRTVEVLVAHQRQGSQYCLCGWGELGHSHPEHVARELEAAGVLRRGPSTGLDALGDDDRSLIIGVLRHAAAQGAEDAVLATRAASGEAPLYGPAASVRMADAQRYLDHAQRCTSLADALAVDRPRPSELGDRPS